MYFIFAELISTPCWNYEERSIRETVTFTRKRFLWFISPLSFRGGYSKKLFGGFLFSVHHSKVNFCKVPKPRIANTSSGSITQVVLLCFNDIDDAGIPQSWCLVTSVPHSEKLIRPEYLHSWISAGSWWGIGYTEGHCWRKIYLYN